MKLYAASVAVVAALAAATLSAEPSHTALKCPPDTPIQFPNAPEPAYVLDGKASDDAAFQALDHESIASIEIVCADDVHRVFGIEARRTAIVVFTKPGPHNVLKAALETIRTRQSAYYAEHGAFANDPAQLDWADESGLMTITLKVSEDGRRWTATGKHLHIFKSVPKSVTGVAPDRAG